MGEKITINYKEKKIFIENRIYDNFSDLHTFGIHAADGLGHGREVKLFRLETCVKNFMDAVIYQVVSGTVNFFLANRLLNFSL